jgi:hypothetical protein
MSFERGCAGSHMLRFLHQIRDLPRAGYSQTKWGSSMRIAVHWEANLKTKIP